MITEPILYHFFANYFIRFQLYADFSSEMESTTVLGHDNNPSG